ncbi:MliC family protein [Sphingopyxis sp.]|uniref:MliC family protein n=1 Tax=Sphingopyxis sp. TaxID=1908224 RepID=UPI0025EBAA44|nr:MliC family protein [Sphingopyxis sp.]MBK6411619.1 MliC family protein [Sphingopyxis sp.]
MRIFTTTFAAIAATLLSGCMTTQPANLGTTYECDRGTRLQVSYLREGALVRINGARAIPFRETPSNAGSVYESAGNRLARNGNTVTWNTAARSAPETCRVINTIQ